MILLVACSLVGVVAAFLEHVRMKTPWWLGLPTLMSSMLLGLLLMHAQQPGDRVGLILTAGADQSLCDRALSEHPEVTEFFTTQQVPNLVAQAIPIADPGDLRWRSAETRRWVIVGHGFDASEIGRLPGDVVGFYAPALPHGFTWLHWPRTALAGQMITVRGRARFPHGGSLRLRDPGGQELSIPVEVQTGESTFAFQVEAKVGGFTHYGLGLLDAAGDTVESVDLSLFVQSPKPLRLLLLQGMPSFETKYLTRYLQDGGAIVWRQTRFGAGRKSHWDFFNETVAASSVPQLNRSLFGQFDVCILDGLTWNHMDKPVRADLLQSVKEGLGLILLPQFWEMETDKGQDELFDGLTLTWEKGPAPMNVRPLLAEDPERALPAVSALPAWIKNQPEVISLVQDPLGRTLAGAVKLEGGRIGTTLLRQSYRYVLQGKAKEHARLWSYLLQSLRRPNSTWTLTPSPIDLPSQVDKPAHLNVLSNGDNPQLLFRDPKGKAVQVALLQSPTAAEFWRGTVYPWRPGWHLLQSGEDETSYPFFVYPDDSFIAWKADRCQRETRHVLELGTKTVTGDGTRRASFISMLIRNLLVLGLLLSSGSAWLLRRRFRRATVAG